MYLSTGFNQGPIGNKHLRKVTPMQRVEIGKRRYNGESAKELATEFGLSAAYIYTISPIEN